MNCVEILYLMSCVKTFWRWNDAPFPFVQWGLFDRQFGRKDAEAPDPEGRIPQWNKASVQEMKEKFIAIGFGPRQVLSLQNLAAICNLFRCSKFQFQTNIW